MNIDTLTRKVPECMTEFPVHTHKHIEITVHNLSVPLFPL